MSRDTSETIVKVAGPSIQPGKFSPWESQLLIPESLPITSSSHSISVRYKLRVRFIYLAISKANSFIAIKLFQVTLTTSCFLENIKADLNVLIGTEAIEDYDEIVSSAQARCNSFTPGHRSRSATGRTAARLTHLDSTHRHSISDLPSYDECMNNSVDTIF